jgi:hypothetical protein
MSPRSNIPDQFAVDNAVEILRSWHLRHRFILSVKAEEHRLPGASFFQHGCV